MQSTNEPLYRCGIVTIGSSHNEHNDQSSKLAVQALTTAGHQVVALQRVTDDLLSIRYLLRDWIDDAGLDVVVALGGTGIDANDVTPEALQPLISKPVPGFGELFRALAFREIGIHAIESRAQAVVCHSTLVYSIPSDPKAVSLAMDRLIVPQLGLMDSPARSRPSTRPLAQSAAE